MARFQETFCSQCGHGFGPGDSGFSHCSDHTPARIKGRYTQGRMVECPSCRGRGYTNPAFDCRWCKGSGEVTEEDAAAFGPDN